MFPRCSLHNTQCYFVWWFTTGDARMGINVVLHGLMESLWSCHRTLTSKGSPFKLSTHNAAFNGERDTTWQSEKTSFTENIFYSYEYAYTQP